MKKLLILFFGVTFTLLGRAQQFTSIHHEQSVFHGAENKTTEWYEQNVNTESYSKNVQRTSCNLEKVVYGWHPYWVGSAFNNYDWSLLSHLSFFSYEVDEVTGNAITTHGWSTADAVDSALAKGIKVTLCVTLFGSSNLTTFLTNTTAKQTLITNLINLVQSRGAHGVNIDFEGLPASQKTNFANFMVDLSNQMHAAVPGSEVSTVLYAVDWSNVFDFSIMDPVVDHFIVMGYAYYYQGSGSTGPCDPLYHFGSSYNYTLSKTITYYLDQGCSKSKLIMGLPYYGYEWPTSSLTVPSSTTGTGVARTFSYVKNNTSGFYSPVNYNWDADSFSDSYAFINSGSKQCFITLETAFRKRLEHINHTGIGGIGIWALGYDNGYSQLWDAINDYFTDCHQDPCSGTIHDFGGPTKNYYNDEDYTWTISPDGATSIDISFTSFDVETGYDTLFIYDGATTAAPLIGSYTGMNSPGSFTTSTGNVTFHWKSDGATVGPGWLANYSCATSTTNPQPVFSLPATTSICQGETVQFVNSSTDATSYFWEFENGTPATSTDTDPLVTYYSSGTYDVTLHAIDGIDTNTLTQTISIMVAGQPTAGFSSNSPVTLPNSAIYFSNTSLNANAFMWNFGDGNTSIDTNPWNDYVTAGTYTVSLICMNYSCPNDTLTQVVEVISNVGLNELSNSPYLVYPNPFNQMIYVKGFSDNAMVSLKDISGKVCILEQKLTKLKPYVGGLEWLAPGSYILEIKEGDTAQQFIIIKE